MPSELLLHRGLVDATGARHRRVSLRPLGGHEEAALAEAVSLDGGAPDERTVHEVLAACIERLGGYRHVTAEHAAALTRGDRQRLALALRGIMLGDPLVLTLRCSSAACGELADLELHVSSLLGGGATEPDPEPQWWAVETPDGVLHVRAPTGADDEACAGLPGGTAQRAGVLWDRLLDVGDPPAAWADLAPVTQQLLARTLADSGTLPDLLFVSACPACGALLELELDPFQLLARELALGADRLLAEVHCLAFHYGWGEEAILALPRPRRWRYLELLRRQLESRPLT
ncbi:hypothetical protein SAMN05444365_10617 [Micromonospora pattaloongensis]|uniref:Uncharacterized protein n=1 Tax=Micromonospora pattaloongensis TaxID=405436 RepID=A0A1H3QMB8_9ACTN|nr:hypothetical protein [Micromonospora pattaloongensis]SDZ14692.1 hypothetical protein SAMN05444365_10617 [Micromonospora pattaloongensis]